MSCMPIERQRYQNRAICLAIVGLIGLAGSRSWAAHPLECIPASAPSVLVFRNLNEFSRNVNQYLTRYFPEAHRIEPRDLEVAFDLPKGTIDYSKPVLLLGTQAEFEGKSLILGFSPKEGSGLRPKPDHPEGIVWSFETGECENFVLNRHGLAFVAGNRRPLRLLRAGSFRKNLFETLDPDQKKVLNESDVFVRLSMDRWRERINPWMTLMSGAISAGVAQNSRNGGNDTETTESTAFISWFSDGARSVLDQMRTVSAGLQFDGKILRITHVHNFMPGESTAQYLNQIRRNKIDFSRMISDKRFMMLLTCNWQSPGENSLSYRVSKMALGLESVARRFDSDKRAKLLKASKELHDQTLGTFFVMGTQRNKPQFVQLLGGSVVRDAKQGLTQMKYFQENAADLVSVFMPGTSYANQQFTSCQCKGSNRKFFEVAFTSKGEDNQLASQLECMYGPKPVFQMAVADTTNLAWTVGSSENSDGICNYLASRPGEKCLSENARVAKLLGSMPADQNVVFLVDTDALFDTLPVFLHAALQKQGVQNADSRVKLASDVTSSKETGPLIGWCASLHKNGITGELLIDADQIPLIVASAKRAALELSRGMHPEMRPPIPPRPPRQP
jgi:hypothetical protein